MATGNSVTSRNATLNSHFGANRHSTLSLATLYVAAFTGDPSGAGVEATGGGYARLAVANNVTTFPTASTSGAISPGIVLQFATSSGAWGVNPYQYNHWGIFDNNTGGTLWYWGPLGSTVTMDGANLTLRITAMTITAAT